jgi:hypothetical protein
MRRGLLELRRVLTTPSRNPRMAVVLGRLLGLAFVICFGTGLYSHFLQDPLPFMHFATRPAGLYQLTQGIHITAGIACFPLLLGKLYSIFPNLFTYPPITGFVNFLERASIAIFVASSLIQIFTGLLDTFQWYPFPFNFRQTHYALSFVIIGSLAIHIAVKLPLISRYWSHATSFDSEGNLLLDVDDAALTPAAIRAELATAPEPVGPIARRVDGLTGRVFDWIDSADSARDAGSTSSPRDKSDAGSTSSPRDKSDAGSTSSARDTGSTSRPRDTGDTGSTGSPDSPGSPSNAGSASNTASTDNTHEQQRTQRTSRRGFLAAIAISTAAVVALTAGQSFAFLDSLNVLAPRKKGTGPERLPINRTARAAKVTPELVGDSWRLTLKRGSVVKEFSRAELLALPQTSVDLPISCVEGWSQMASWRGVRLKDLMSEVGVKPTEGLRLTSLEASGGYRVTEMGYEYVQDDLTLVALELNGETLHLDHGYPARMIAPGRPGVLQTKWLTTIEVI